MTAKAKGSSFERKISKILSERFFERTGIKESFRRNLDSGSFFGGNNKKRADVYDTSKATFGDIIIPEGFKFSIECKHYKSPPSFSIVTKQDYKQWNEWLKQANTDAATANKDFLLIIKYNGIEEIAITKNNYPEINHVMRYKDYYVYSLSDFIKLPDEAFFE